MTKKTEQAKVKYDLGVAGRFKFFRKKYVSNNGIEAARMLKFDQSRISRCENGLEPLPLSLIRKLEVEHDLNRDWLLDNLGAPTKHKEKVKPTPVMLSEMMDKIQTLTMEVNILNKNYGKLWDIVEAQGKMIEKLREETR